MSDASLKLARAPIVEAVVDIDCDLPPGLELGAIRGAAQARFGDRYPNVRTRLLQQQVFAARPDTPPEISERVGIQGYLFLSPDEKQIVQVRAQGYSFNRLAPYSSLDDYLPEIERTWREFLSLVTPVLVRQVRLRYINRIPVPLIAEAVNIGRYLQRGPGLPEGREFEMTSFLNQYVAVERSTDNRVAVAMTPQPMEAGVLPIVFDIEAARPIATESGEWAALATAIDSLRRTKNRVFQDALTPTCLELFR